MDDENNRLSNQETHTCDHHSVNEVAYLKFQLNTILTSETWRLTLPIRVILKSIRYVKENSTKNVKRMILQVPYLGPKIREIYSVVVIKYAKRGRKYDELETKVNKDLLFKEKNYELKAIDLFDEDFYIKSNQLSIGKSKAYEHYRNIGAKQYASPNNFFDVHGYIFDNPDVSKFNFNVLEHYCNIGRFSNSRPMPIFDADFYFSMYKDCQNSKLHPYEHFLKQGYKFRKPTSPVLPFLDHNHVFSQSNLSLPHLVTICVPTYKNYKDTYRCLASLMLHSSENISTRFVLVDDAPESPIKHLIIRYFPQVEYLANEENLGFLLSCNEFAKSCDTKYLAIINSDTIVHPNWLDSLVELASNEKDIGYIGSMLINTDGSIQEAGGTIYKNGWGFSNHAGKNLEVPEANFVREVDCVTGASIFLLTEAFRSVAYFDETFAPAFYEEYDLAFKMRSAGYRVLFQPRSRIMHVGSGSYGPEKRDQLSVRNHGKFVRKWSSELEFQPSDDLDSFVASHRQRNQTIVVIIDDAVPRPDTNAGSQTIFSIVKYLSSNNIRVIFWAAEINVEGKYQTALREMGVETHSPKDDFFSWFHEHERHISTVLLSRPLVAKKYMPFLRDNFAGKLAYYTHDLHYLRMKRAEEIKLESGKQRDSVQMQRIENDIFTNVDLILSPSDIESRIISKVVPDGKVVTVTAYMYHEHQVSRKGSYSNQKYLLFVGGFAHEPNVDAVRFLIQEIMPNIWKQRSDLKLFVVGSDFPMGLRDNLDERISVMGHVDVLTDIYSGAFASISPLRFGAGVKGKVVESLRFGIPVITSEVGIEGTNLKNGHEVLLAETSIDYSKTVLTLLESLDLWDKLSTNGNEYVKRNYNWEIAGRQVLELLTSQK